MDAERERRAEDLFYVAADLPVAEREAFFARHCPDDPELRAEIESLLREDDEGTKDFLESPVLADDGRPTAELFSTGLPASEPIPERIGRYRVLERIGEGGMGTVYRAEQSRPVVRQVAIKVVKRGMATERVLARFELERQTLAMMEHPGIARIFDGGTHGSSDHRVLRPRAARPARPARPVPRGV